MWQPTVSSRELPQKCHRGRLRMLLWYIFLSLGAVGHLLFGEAQAKELLNWCVVGDEELGVCTQLIKYLNQQDESAWACHKASSVGDCITAVENGDADFVTLDPGKAYLAYKYHGLFPVLSLTTGNSNTQSNAVAVVKADFCGTATLKGKVSCHSGYRELAGWYAPVGMMLNNETIPQVDDGNDLNSVTEYFARSCAPGDEPASGICSACFSSSSCSAAEDPYAGDAGAIGCLMNGGDVAFVRESSVLQYLNQTNSEQGSSNITKDNFRNLCLNFTCQALDDPDTCVWLRVPNDLIMTRIGLADIIREKTVSVLEDLSQKDEFQAEFFSPSKNPKGLIFQPGVTGMVPVTTNLETILGTEVLQAIAAVHRLDLPFGGLGVANGSTELPNVKWCAVGEQESEVCNKFIILLNNQSTWMTWSCTMQDSVQDCLLDVQNGKADVLSVSADVLFLASHYHGLSAIMSEKCNDTSSGGYWTVAVVPTEVCHQSQDFSFAALKGKRSCHGVGYGDSAGWKSPVATIANLDLVHIPTLGNDHSLSKDIYAVTEFFSSVCAPGTDDSKLCTGCQSSCTPDNSTTRVDSGAQDCLKSGGDVAFIRCPQDMTPGVFMDIDRERFSLLCPRGGCANMSEVDTCNFFYVPFKAVVVRDSMERIVINGMTDTLATVSKSDGFKALFMKGANNQSLLFSQSLVSFSKVIKTTDQYLNTSLDMFATYYELYSPPPGVPMSIHSGRNRDLTIIYGVAIAVVLLIAIALGIYCYIRSKKLKENAVSRRQAMEYTRAEWQ